MWNDADRTAAAIAEGQHGAIHRDSLLASGLTGTMIDRRVAGGQLTRCAPAVFVFGGSPDTDRRNLVVQALSIGPDAAISHDSAAHLWGLINRRPREIHAVVRRWQREHRLESIVHESLDLELSDRTWLCGVPVTTATRTVVDLGATSPWMVERALSEGLRRDLFGLAEVIRFVERVQRRGRRGVGVIRPLLEMYGEITGRTESLLEDRFLRVLFERGVPLPAVQYEVLDDVGRFVCRADFAYRTCRVLIELDGRAYHSDSAAFQRDRDKQNQTLELGWQTLRFTWADVHREPDRVASTVRSFLRN